MDSQGWKQLRGLKRLLHDGIERGADFVEKHHRHAAAKPFAALATYDAIAPPIKAIRWVHDGVLTLTYGSIRTVNRAVEVIDDWIVDRLAPD